MGTGMSKGDEPGGVSGTDPRSAVLDGLVSDGKLAKIMANHFRLNFNLVEGFAIVHTNHAANHLGEDDHVTKILDGLYLGNIRDSQDKDNLVKNGVSHVLSICNNAKPALDDMKYLCIAAADSSNQNLMQYFKECIKFIHECRMHGGGCIVHCLAGVSRSTTVVVAYLMTVTDYGWEECLSAVKAARSYASPNFGFQQQLQEFEATLVKEYRRWLQTEYGENRFNDKQEIRKLLAQYDEQQKQQRLRYGERDWKSHTASVYPLPYKAYGGTGHSWVNR